MAGLLLIAAANALDLGTFLVVAGLVGAGGESNPLVAALWDGYGPLSVIVLKVVGVIVIVWLIGLTPVPWHAWLVAAAVAVAVFGAVTNVVGLALS